MAQQNDKPKPVKDFRVGKIQASVWRTEVERSGRTLAQHSVRIRKQFRAEDGSYEDTDYFFPNELPELILLAQRAYEYVVLTESKDADEATLV